MKTFFIVPACICLLFSSDIIAQSFLEKNKEITIMAGMANTKIKNSNLTRDENIVIDNKNGISFSFEFSKYVANRVGFGLGFGCSTYNRAYSQKGFYQISGLTDKDGYDYDKLITSDMDYEDKLAYLDIPVLIHILLGSSEQFYGFFDAGLLNEFLISGIHTEQGSIETMAVYPTGNPYWSDLTRNNPYYGYKNTGKEEKDPEKYKFYNGSLHLSLGLAAAMTDKLYLRVAPFLNYGFSDIMGKDGKGKDYSNVVGITSTYKKTTLFSAGLNVGFAFNL
jgi:hypothetical protein